MTTNEELIKSILELRESQAQTDRQMKVLSQKIDRINKLAVLEVEFLDSYEVTEPIGLEIEEFFYSSLKKKPKIANIDFDYIYQNDIRNIKGRTQEIDILLENGNSIGVVEVKNRVTQESIDQLDKIIDNFYYFHRDYEGYKLVGALAGKIFPKHLQEQALNKGYSAITQQGDHIEQRNP